MACKEFEHKGIKYTKKELINALSKDGSVISMLQKDNSVYRGAAIEFAKNQFIIAALDAPNESTFVHEMAHTGFEPDLTTEERQTFIDDYNEQFGDNTKDWNTDVSEFFARAWEKYLSNGRKVGAKEVKDPTKRMIIQEVFDKFTEYLQGIYNGVITYNNSKGVTKPIEVSSAAQAVFDNIMGIKPTTQTDGNNKQLPSVTAEQEIEVEVLTEEQQILNTLESVGMTPEMLALIGGVDSLIDYVDLKKIGKKKCK